MSRICVRSATTRPGSPGWGVWRACRTSSCARARSCWSTCPAEYTAPEAILCRSASAGQVGGALADYFRTANLRALSELARAWMAGTAEAVSEDLLARRRSAGSPAPPVVVAGDSGSGWGEVVIRRAAQLARAEDAQLLVVHVQISDGLARPPAGELDRHRELTADLGGPTPRSRGALRRRRSPRPPGPRARPPWWSGAADPASQNSPTVRWRPGCAGSSPPRQLKRYGNLDRCRASISPQWGIPYA